MLVNAAAPKSRKLASQVGRLSKARNGSAHPDVTLVSEIQTIVAASMAAQSPPAGSWDDEQQTSFINKKIESYNNLIQLHYTLLSSQITQANSASDPSIIDTSNLLATHVALNEQISRYRVLDLESSEEYVQLLDMLKEVENILDKGTALEGEE